MTVIRLISKSIAGSCPKLIIPVINEIFQEHYTGNEEIRFLPNEHFLNRQAERKMSVLQILLL